MSPDSYFIVFDRISSICIIADMSLKARLEANFEREHQKVEYLFKERPGLTGLAAFPPSVLQFPGKYLYFSVTKVSEKSVVDPE